MPDATRNQGGLLLRVAGFTAGQVVKIGVAAVVFILVFKLLAAKTGVPALQSVAGAI